MKNRWNLTTFYKSDNDPVILKEREIVTRQVEKFVKKWEPRTDYLKDPSVLKQALDEYNKWWSDYGLAGKQGYYLDLRTAQDQNNSQLKALANQSDELSRNLYNQILFFEHRLGKVSQAQQQKFLKAKQLSSYNHFLERIFEEAKYQLSELEEKILTLKSGSSFSHWVRMTNSILAKQTRQVLNDKGKLKVLSFNEILGLVDHKDKKIRDRAAEAFNDILDKFKDSTEAEFNAVLEHKKINDQLRGYSRPDQSRHLADDMDSEVVDTLVQTVNDHFDIPKRYYKLKAKLFNLPYLEYHERNLEYGKINKSYSYELAVKLVKNAFKKLDPEFSQIFEIYLKNGQIDVFPYKGKHSGAACYHDLITLPTFIYLNFTNKLNDVLTLAHELGHGINNELMRQKQIALYFGNSLATAEVASTFMEDFVLEELLENANDELRLSLMMMKLNDDISSIFRQIAMYKFEQEVHQEYRDKGYLSSDDIGNIFLKHMKAYMGPAIKQSPGSQNWWMYVSHFRSYFYVYSYANGLLISKALQAKVHQDPKFIQQVKKFLSNGVSKSPAQSFQELGIDIKDPQFWSQGIERIELLLKETEQLAKKLKKI